MKAFEEITDGELLQELKEEYFNYPEFTPKQKRILNYYFFHPTKKTKTVQRIAMYFGYEEKEVAKALKEIQENEVFKGLDIDKISAAAIDRLTEKYTGIKNSPLQQ